MRTVRFVSVALCLLVAVSLVGASQRQAPPSPPPIALDAQTLSAFLQQEVESRQLVGLSLAVVRDGTVLFAGGAGRSSIATAAPVTPDTRFAIGSITKQFTCACVLLLAEDGKLAVTDKVSKWFPTLTKADGITVLDLMNHVSGYPDYYPLDFAGRPMQTAIAIEDLITRFGTRPLDFAPRSRYSYSNTGYLMLGRIVSKTAGEPFASFLKRRVLDPLGLRHTVFEPSPATGPGYADGYVTWALGPPEVSAREGAGWIDSAGALYSTPSDVAAWDMALISGRLLTPQSYALMTSGRTLTDGTTSNYGCGLALRKRGDQDTIMHTGAVAGFYGINTVVPATRSAAILLSNFDAYEAVDAVYARIMNALAPLPAQTPVTRAAVPTPAPKPLSVPTIAGPPAAEATRLLFVQLQKGQVNRAGLGDEYNDYLTDEKIRGAAARLAPYGPPASVEVDSLSERGGMEVARTRVTCAKGELRGVMYRTPDGKVQEFFVLKK